MGFPTVNQFMSHGLAAFIRSVRVHRWLSQDYSNANPAPRAWLLSCGGPLGHFQLPRRMLADELFRHVGVHHAIAIQIDSVGDAIAVRVH